jgi:hypothetical protein
VDEDRGSGLPGGPPPPPGAVSGSAPVPAPPPPPDAQPAPGAAQPGWGAGTQGQPGWGTPADAPETWGAVSPEAQVDWGRPPSGSNGCLKGCLIVGGILAVLAVVAVVGLFIAGGRLIQQIEEDPDSVFGGECPFVSAFEVSDALGTDIQVFELAGLAETTMGAILDKRLLRDAPDCYILAEDGTTGRIAVLDGGGQAAFAAAAAEGQHIRAQDADVGDEAFCTTVDGSGFGGVLVRFGERVVYVSVLDQSLDQERACELASIVAGTLAP